LASADWNSGRPGAGIASLVWKESDSARETVFRERVVELSGHEWHRTVPVRWPAKDGKGGSQHRQRQPVDPARRGGVDGDAGPAQATAQQHLRDQPAEGVTHQDRRLRQRPHERVVMIDYLAEADLRRCLGVVEFLVEFRYTRPRGGPCTVCPSAP